MNLEKSMKRIIFGEFLLIGGIAINLLALGENNTLAKRREQILSEIQKPEVRRELVIGQESLRELNPQNNFYNMLVGTFAMGMAASYLTNGGIGFYHNSREEPERA